MTKGLCGWFISPVGRACLSRVLTRLRSNCGCRTDRRRRRECHPLGSIGLCYLRTPHPAAIMLAGLASLVGSVGTRRNCRKRNVAMDIDAA